MKRSGIEIIVYGKVQGVFFRKFTREEAQKSGLKGFVKNKDDGTVFIRAFGDNEALFQFIQWCKTGPSRAEVTKLVTKTIPYEDFNSFEIQR